MIDFKEAQDRLASHVQVSPIHRYALGEVLHCQLAADIQAPYDLPLFTNSAMDGYAVRAHDIERSSETTPVTLPVQMTVQAGVDPDPLLLGHAAKIMTGAKVPDGADTVVMKEHVQEKTEQVTFHKNFSSGLNIRLQGEEIQKGECALRKGTVLSPASIGFLSGLGIREIPTYRKPVISLLTTGSELVGDPKDLKPGKIFDSNSHCLRAALQEFPYQTLRLLMSLDSPEKLTRVLGKELASCDFMILTGGVSVGDYDYTKAVLADLGVQTIFWKVAQKPGKPIYFGVKDGTYVFGLPGNPASALVCYYEYVRPALRKFLGAKGISLEQSQAELVGSYQKKAGFRHFVRATAYYEAGRLKVAPLKGQGSHLMQAFSEANCLMQAHEEHEELQPGTTVTLHWLPASRRTIHA